MGKKIKETQIVGDKVYVLFEDGTNKVFTKEEYNNAGGASAFAKGNEIEIEVEEEDDATDNSNASNPPSSNSKKTNFYNSIDSKYQKYFQDKGAGNKPRLVIPAGTSRQEKQELTNYLNSDNNGSPVIQSITQGATPGYKESGLFFGGLGPEDYEEKFAIDNLGEDAASKMNAQQKRDYYFQEIGLDGKYLGKGPEIYNDKTFVDNFYTSYKSFLPEGEFREGFGDDGKFGFDHYDSKTKEVEQEIKDDSSITITPEPCPEGFFRNSETGECEKIKDDPIPTTPPGDPNVYFDPDRKNLVAALSQKVEPLFPQLQQVDSTLPEVAYESYATKVANQQSNNQRLLDFIENSGAGNQGVGAAIGAVADSIDKTTGIIADTENRNINRFNTYEGKVADTLNKTDIFNEKARADYVDKVNEVKQNYNDQMFQKNRNVANEFAKMWWREKKQSTNEELLYPNSRRVTRSSPRGWLNPYSGKDVGSFDPSVNPMNYSPQANLGTYQEQLDKLVRSGISEDNATKMIIASNRNNQSNRNNRNPYNFEEGGKTKYGFGSFLMGGFFE